MASQNSVTTLPISQHESSDALWYTSPSAKGSQEGDINLPPVERVLANLTTTAPSLPTRGSENVPPEEQMSMLRSLHSLLRRTGEEKEGKCFDLKELHASFDQADADARRERRDLNALENVRVILLRLWRCNSDNLLQAAEVLADGSREPSWRVPYGQAGILDFFLQVIATKEVVNDDILLHSLRLIGNSCADTDENREIVVSGNHTANIVRHFLNTKLINVAVPVIYNICTDYEPAQSQAAANSVAYILLKLIKDSVIDENSALLSFVYDLIEMTSKEQGIERSPDGTVKLITDLAVDPELDLPQFSCLVNSLVAYLGNQRFQDVCITRGLVEAILSVLKQSLLVEADPASSDDIKTLSQLRLKINQALADVSGSQLFMEHYPLGSTLTRTLVSWLKEDEEQLQICSCVMLGNLARTDTVCHAMVRDLEVHKDLISILNRDARGAVLHSVLGFLKNLAIAADNKLPLGDAGIIPAVSRLWGSQTIPQVQFSAASTVRQVVMTSTKNISRLLDPLSTDPNSPDHTRTYLSSLLSLFEKTDSTPTKIDIGRTIACICRTLSPKAREESSWVNSLYERLFNLHGGVAHPIGCMVTQTQWPVVRSEGWFALALMASSRPGSLAVVECVQDANVERLLRETLSAEISDDANETDRLRITKDRDNTVVLVKEMLGNASDALPPVWKDTLENVLTVHVSQHLKEIKE